MLDSCLPTLNSTFGTHGYSLHLCTQARANFKALCTGEKGVSETAGVTLSYTNILIHRVVPGGWIQGGDIVDELGSGGELFYGAIFDGNYINNIVFHCL